MSPGGFFSAATGFSALLACAKSDAGANPTRLAIVAAMIRALILFMIDLLLPPLANCDFEDAQSSLVIFLSTSFASWIEQDHFSDEK